MKIFYRLTTVAGLVLVLGATACATRTVYVREKPVERTVVKVDRRSPPTMVEVRPGVWVVEDYPQSVFYTDNYYWRYRDGVWYRSASLYDAPVRISVGYVPVRVRRVERPAAYIYYRAPAAAARVRVDARVY